MKKVVIFANSYKSIFNFRIELVEELIRVGHDVVIIVPKDNKNVLFKSYKLLLIEIPFSRFGINPFKELLTLVKLYFILKRTNPNVVYSFTIKPNLYTGLLKSLFKFRFKFNPTITGLGRGIQKSFGSIFFSYLYKFSFSEANKVFFQNSSNMDFFVSRNLIVNKKKLILLNGSGINIQKYKFSSPEERPLTNFLLIARISKDKGLDEYFSLIDKSLVLFPTISFGLIGMIEDKKYSKKLIKYSNYKNFVYYGELTQEQTKQKIIDCDCGIVLSHHEGMSNVLLETSAIGRPSIAPNIPGCKEIIQNQKSGFLFELYNETDLLSKIKEFLSLTYQERKEIGINANKLVLEKFDRSIVTKTYLECL